MNTLVIKKWHSSPNPDSTGRYIEIVGRTAGLFGWLLALLGIDPITSIEMKADKFVFATGSLSGQTKNVVPIEGISSYFYGYYKPWREALIIGLLTFWLLFLPGLLYYWLNKTLIVGIVEQSGLIRSITFKRSVIEGQNIDENQASAVIEQIQSLVDAHRRR